MTRATTVIILTNAFPYQPGEHFFEAELAYWAAAEIKVIVAPLSATGASRPTPPQIQVDLRLARSMRGWRGCISHLRAVLSPLFWKEASSAWNLGQRHLGTYARCLRAAAKIILLKQGLHDLVSESGTNAVVYAYWHDVQAYAAALLKRERLITSVYSRAHGFDLYQERRPHCYMPFKRAFAKDVDTVFSVSEQGRSYLEHVYGIPPTQLEVSRLGVHVPPRMNMAAAGDTIHILSVASCTNVKRIDRTIDALADTKIEGKTILWTHIGDGPLLDQLIARAHEKLRPNGVDFNFMGAISNKEVQQYYDEQPIDFFINTSESEGIPVSIMEAMSHGIPVIAPAVGGVCELVNEEVGRLLSPQPDAKEITLAICWMSEFGRSPKIRLRARMAAECNYSAQANYNAIINKIATRP
ncbi:glycosyltransferase [Ramlibacter sp. G-1-2-2]|uniref:Glycosyltransferase n=1 Tax=Ramlibacter agri TaxID=2728837 RepID=A0A848HAW1_9BURK|nr:glycosyltransferase [Ramlibacter agri]NML46551.1 glycosyltransferase [Ramlibacter agri]